MEEPLLQSSDENPEIPVLDSDTWSYRLKMFSSILNLIVHSLIGGVIGVTLLFAFKNGLPLKSTPLHIVLCIIGYKFLMANAILSLSPHNGWSSRLKLADRRRAHWMLQLAGSSLAMAGSLIKILNKTVHWNTLHGQFGLVALVFTGASLINGLTSLWSYELRHRIPTNISKLSHIIFGTVSFTAASVCLCLGFCKDSFREWVNEALAYNMITLTGIATLIVVLNPLVSLFVKSRRIFRC